MNTETYDGLKKGIVVAYELIPVQAMTPPNPETLLNVFSKDVINISITIE